MNPSISGATKKWLLFLTSVSIAFSSCQVADQNTAETGTVEADYIEYSVEYLEKMAGDIPTNLLPDRMIAYYTKDYILTEIDGFFGQFSLVQVAHLRKRSVTTMLNFFGTKVFYTGGRNEIPAGIMPLENPEISFTEDTRMLAGVTCQKAVIRLDDEVYDIYYTRDINVRSPNITTPYHFIDHVLCDFRVQLSYLKMRLIMNNKESREVDTSKFTVPEEYTQVSRAAMEDIINSLFTKE